MTDDLDEDPAVPVVDAVHDSVVTPVRAVPPLELEPKRSADPVRVGGQHAVDELDRSSRDLLR
jgi:hypothetical protein